MDDLVHGDGNFYEPKFDPVFKTWEKQKGANGEINPPHLQPWLL